MAKERIEINPKTLSALEYSLDNCNIRIWVLFDPECRSANLLFVNNNERIIKVERLWIEHREELLDQLVEDRLRRFYKYKTTDSE